MLFRCSIKQILGQNLFEEWSCFLSLSKAVFLFFLEKLTCRKVIVSALQYLQRGFVYNSISIPVYLNISFPCSTRLQLKMFIQSEEKLDYSESLTQAVSFGDFQRLLST